MRLIRLAEADFRFSLLSPEQRLVAARLENAAIAIHWAGADGRILWANEAELRLLGYPSPAYIGRMVAEFAADHERLAEASRRLARGEKLVDYAMPMRASDGSIKNLLVNSSICTERGRFRHTLCFSREAGPSPRELELQAQLEQARKEVEGSRAEVADFSAIASHDLHSPLRKILIFCDRLNRERATLDDEGRDMLCRIRASADRMERLLDDLRGLSRVTTDALPMCSLDANRSVAEAVAELHLDVERAGATVEVGELPQVRADPGQFRLLFRHLIANALKFCRAGGGCAVVITGRRDGDQVELRVADNGIGFDPKYAELIFKPFQRLHGPQEYPGSGLGLAVCRRIAQRHGGSIRGEGKLGEGATFIVRLPAAEARVPSPGDLGNIAS